MSFFYTFWKTKQCFVQHCYLSQRSRHIPSAEYIFGFIWNCNPTSSQILSLSLLTSGRSTANCGGVEEEKEEERLLEESDEVTCCRALLTVMPARANLSTQVTRARTNPAAPVCEVNKWTAAPGPHIQDISPSGTVVRRGSRCVIYPSDLSRKTTIVKVLTTLSQNDAEQASVQSCCLTITCGLPESGTSLLLPWRTYSVQQF